MPTQTPRLCNAKFAGTCYTCGKQYAPGQPIAFLSGASPIVSKRTGRPVAVTWHQSCAEPQPPYGAPPFAADQHEEGEDQAQPAPIQRSAFEQPMQHGLPLPPPAPSTRAPVTQASTSGDGLADILAAALKGRVGSSIDPAQVRQIVAEELAARVAPMIAGELSKLPSTDPKALAAQATRDALKAVQDTLSASTAMGGASAIVGTIPSADPHFAAVGEAYDTTKSALERDAHVLLSGPSGSGKTYVAEQVCAELSRRMVVVSCADGLTYGALVVTTTLELQQGHTVTRSRYGALPLAMRAGAVLLVDEADQLVPELAAILHAVMEPDQRRRRLYVPETGETIQAEEGFAVVLTCNGLRDTSGAYHGHRLSGALLTRTWHAAADYLSTTQERDLLVRAGAPKNLAAALAACMASARKEHVSGNVSVPPSTRTALQIARAMLGQKPDGTPGASTLSWTQAWQRLYMGALSEHERAKVATFVMQADSELRRTGTGA